MLNRVFLSFSVILLIALLLNACSGKTAYQSGADLAGANTEIRPEPETGAVTQQWPTALPGDRLQPWERADSAGYVIPDEAGHAASAINSDSEYVAGIERYLEGGSVADNGEATTLNSTAGALSHAIYRIPLGSEESGTVSVDANLITGEGYYVGLANYAAGRWNWHGPFSDNHVRLDTTAGNFTSALGSVFVCVAAWDGTSVDVVGIGVNPLDPADTTAPPPPSAPTATPVNSGLLLGWVPVAAGDLAGYRVYYNSQWFLDGQGTGVKVTESLEGLTTHLLGGLSAETFVRISAVDTSGNESALSDFAVATPLEGAALDLTVAISAPSVMLNQPITLTAGGADMYDIDTGGDGIFDITGAVTGSATVDTSGTGVIRPRVRGSSGGGSMVALGGVSLIVSSYSRPVAVAEASPASGDAPLLVNFSGDESTDFDGSIVGGGWDFDGDGTYDVWDDTDIVHVTSADHTYTVPGVYNAKLRVVDDDGAWDVDTVAISVTPPPDPANAAPTAGLSIGAGEESGDAPHTVNFDASGSTDGDGTIVRYWWDWDGNGGYEETTASPTHSHTFTGPGIFNSAVMAEDDDGATDTASVEVTVTVAGNDSPTASLGPESSSGTTPHTVSFDASASSDPDGTIVRYDYDFDDDGTWEAFDAGDTVSWTYDGGGIYTARLRVTDDAGAQATDTSMIDVNEPPEARLSATPPDGNKGVTIRYDAAASSDPDGTIDDYEWDLDDDGVYNETGDEADNQGNDAVLQVYPQPGYKPVRVRVTDDDGATDTAAVTVTVHGWVTTTADATGWVGEHTSLAIVNGNPAISYYNYVAADGNLKYVRALDSSGSSWGSAVTVDSTDDVGTYNSLAVVDGHPAISYHDGSPNFDLKYVRANDATGSSWGTPVTVDSTGFVGRHSSLVVVNGKPAIGYYDSTGTNVKYVQASDATGSAWGTPVTVYSTGIVGIDLSMQLVNGYPAICYHDNNPNYDLKFVRASDADGTTWGSPVTVDSTGDVGTYTSMAVVHGNPAICYFDSTNTALKYARANNASGSSWGTPLTLDNSGSVGWYGSLAVVDGKPSVSYWTLTSNDLRYIQAMDASGGSWDTPSTLDSAGFVGRHTSIAEVAGNPGISYWDESNHDVKYAIRY